MLPHPYKAVVFDTWVGLEEGGDLLTLDQAKSTDALTRLSELSLYGPQAWHRAHLCTRPGTNRKVRPW